MITIFQIAKRAKRADRRLHACIRARLRDGVTHPRKLVTLNQYIGFFKKILFRNIPEMLVDRHVLADDGSGRLAKPFRCALPKKQQRRLGIIPYLPDPKLALAA